MRPRTKAILDFLDRPFILAVVLALGGLATKLATKLPVVGESIAHFLTFTIPIPVWGLLLLVVVVFVVWRVVRRWMTKPVVSEDRSSVLAPPPRWADYSADTFFDMHWEWKWGGDDNETVMNLKNFCPTDSTPLKSGLKEATCSTCGQRFLHLAVPAGTLHENVERQIQGKRRNGTYVDVGEPF